MCYCPCGSAVPCFAVRKCGWDGGFLFGMRTTENRRTCHRPLPPPSHGAAAWPREPSASAGAAVGIPAGAAARAPWHPGLPARLQFNCNWPCAPGNAPTATARPLGPRAPGLVTGNPAQMPPVSHHPFRLVLAAQKLLKSFCSYHSIRTT